jgi:hypothetical protein
VDLQVLVAEEGAVMQLRSPVVVFAITLIFGVSVLAQDMIVNVNLTTLEVFFGDETGRAVLDLTADDFEIFENGQSMPVRHFSLEFAPVHIGLVLDRSSSVRPVKETVDEAIATLLGAAAPDDQFFLVTFAGTNKLKVPMTTDRNTIYDAIRKAKLEYGTRSYDVMIDALDVLAKDGPARKGLVVFSDGADHYSSHTFKQVIDASLRYGYDFPGWSCWRRPTDIGDSRPAGNPNPIRSTCRYDGRQGLPFVEQDGLSNNRANDFGHVAL